jgi:hypothetical protein
MKWLMGLAAGSALLVGLLILMLWVHDLREDRKHSIVVKWQTPVFADAGNELCGGPQLTVAQPGTTLHVQRIRYWKNCATVDVVLPDTRKGHLVLGQGEVSVNPPLP